MTTAYRSTFENDERRERNEREHRRRILQARIAHAEQADREWPTTRRRCDLFHLQRELERLKQD